MVGGLAFTIEPVVVDKPVDGDQLYVVAPMAVKVTVLPPGLQIKALDGLTVTGGGMQSGLAVLNKSFGDEEAFFVFLALSPTEEVFWL